MSYRALAAMFGLGSFSPEGAARRGLKVATSASYRAEHPKEFDRIVRTRLAFSPSLSSYLRQAKSVANFDASRRVQYIGAPTLVIHGSADRYVPVSNAYALARAVPGAELRVFDGAGHLVFIERAEEVNAVVSSFLLGVQEAHGVREARLSSAPEMKLEEWLRRLLRAIGHSARKLRDRLAR
jgi:pimeloyl-ACP methyl ester carboxylesterase